MDDLAAGSLNLDCNYDLIAALVVHSVSTVQGFGWEGTKNGALLKRATGLIDAFVTIDGNLQYQQNVSILPFGITPRVSLTRQNGCRRARHRARVSSHTRR